jgi:hypothetical protein
VEALRIFPVIEQDGELRVTNLPLKQGQRVELLVLTKPTTVQSASLTAAELRASGLLGIWADRTDIEDSPTFACQLCTRAENRHSPNQKH